MSINRDIADIRDEVNDSQRDDRLAAWDEAGFDQFDPRPTREEIEAADDNSTTWKCVGCQGGTGGYYHEHCWNIR